MSARSSSRARALLGGDGIDKVPALAIQAAIKGALTRRDPKLSLFFTDTTGGRRAGRALLRRLEERTDNRDKDISLPSLRAQLKAVKRWGRQVPSNLSAVRQPVLVANGENDRMVPSQNTIDLAARLPKSELVPLYADSGHGGSSSTTRISSQGRLGSSIPELDRMPLERASHAAC